MNRIVFSSSCLAFVGAAANLAVGHQLSVASGPGYAAQRVNLEPGAINAGGAVVGFAGSQTAMFPCDTAVMLRSGKLTELGISKPGNVSAGGREAGRDDGPSTDLLGQSVPAAQNAAIDELITPSNTIPRTLLGTASEATCINSAGTICGYAYPNAKPIANGETIYMGWPPPRAVFVWKNGRTTWPGIDGVPKAINRHGVLIGRCNLAHESKLSFDIPFVWENGKTTYLSFPGASRTEVSAINDSGVVVGSYNRVGTTRAYSWCKGRYTALPSTGVHWSTATAINNSGLIVGSFSAPNNKMRACEWYRQTMKPLPDLGGGLNSAGAVNSHGDIAGTVFDPGSYGEADPNHIALWRKGRLLDVSRHVTGLPEKLLPQVIGIDDRGAILAGDAMRTEYQCYLLRRTGSGGEPAPAMIR